MDAGAVGRALISAVVDPSGWQRSMDIVERATGSAGAILFDIKNRLANIPRSRSMEPAFETYVRGGWIHRDERYRLAPFLMRRGVATELDLITPDEIARSAYYQEFLAPLGLRWCAVVKIAAGDQVWALSLQRSIGQGPYSPGEIQRLGELSGELAAVAALSHAVGMARAESALAVYSATGTAAVMLDRRGDVLKVNAAAEKLLGSDVQVSRMRLVPRDRNVAAALDRSLHELLRQTTASDTRPPIVLPRTVGRPILAYPMRLSGISADVFSPCQAIIVLIDPDIPFQSTEAVLRNCLGLTTAEAKLALKLATGESLETAAEQTGITRVTARNQLKSIFAKTDTHCQAELILLVMKLGSQYLQHHRPATGNMRIGTDFDLC